MVTPPHCHHAGSPTIHAGMHPASGDHHLAHSSYLLYSSTPTADQLARPVAPPPATCVPLRMLFGGGRAVYAAPSPRSNGEH